MKVWDFYIAGPLFSTAEKNYNYEMYRHLMKMGYSCFLPQLAVQVRMQPLTIFECDYTNLNRSARVIAICDGADMDSGTAWECGNFYGKGEIYAIRSDFRQSGDDDIAGFNLMISQSANETFKCREDLYNFIGDAFGRI